MKFSLLLQLQIEACKYILCAESLGRASAKVSVFKISLLGRKHLLLCRRRARIKVAPCAKMKLPAGEDFLLSAKVCATRALLERSNQLQHSLAIFHAA
jgi:hypothetical protein